MVLFTLGTGLWERWTGLVGKDEWVDNGMGELVEVLLRLIVRVGSGGRPCLGVWCLIMWWCFGVRIFFWRVVDGKVPRWGRWVEGLVSGRRRSSR